MNHEKLKNYLIIALSIIVVLLLILVLYFAFWKKDEIKLKGSVIGFGEGYVILEGEENDYILKTNDEYSIGTILEIETNEIDESQVPSFIYNGKVTVLEKNNEKSFMEGTVDITKDSNTNSSKTDSNFDSNSNYSSNSNSNISSNSNSKSNEVIEESSIPESVKQENDEIVLAYFSEADEIDPKKNESAFKNTFVTIVDFLFYDGKIKGVSFSDITTKTKLTVLKYALKLDQKVDEYFPNYKEKISNTTSKVYTSIKGKIVSTYLEITTSICQKNDALCESAKSDFQSMKKSFGITWNFLKEIAKSGIQNVKDWYEIYSGK